MGFAALNPSYPLTGGQGRYAIEFSHYDPVPPQVQKQLIDAYKPRVEED